MQQQTTNHRHIFVALLLHAKNNDPVISYSCRRRGASFLPFIHFQGFLPLTNKECSQGAKNDRRTSMYPLSCRTLPVGHIHLNLPPYAESHIYGTALEATGEIRSHALDISLASDYHSIDQPAIPYGEAPPASPDEGQTLLRTEISSCSSAGGAPFVLLGR